MVGALTAPAAFAAPDAPDGIMGLLSERGLLAPDGPMMSLAPPLAATPALSKQVRSTATEMVHTAMNFLGVPYRRGGDSESTGFDCSGFTRHVIETTLGVALPRRADEQAKADGLVPIKRDELAPGDLVFFNTLRRTFSHVGIYVGEGKFIHAPRAGGEVRVEDMRFKYWAKRFTGARRIDAPTSAAPAAPTPMKTQPAVKPMATVDNPAPLASPAP